MKTDPKSKLESWAEAGAVPGFARLDTEAFPLFEPGWVWLVGAGPGAPGLMSLLCYHAMQACDVVVYDALVNPDILRWVKVGAEIQYAGKRGGKPSPLQRDISERLIELARARPMPSLNAQPETSKRPSTALPGTGASIHAIAGAMQSCAS